MRVTFDLEAVGQNSAWMMSRISTLFTSSCARAFLSKEAFELLQPSAAAAPKPGRSPMALAAFSPLLD
jgi:hypothetical protein